METLAVRLTEKFIDRNVVTADKKELCIMGLTLILSDIINFSLILCVGILTKSFVYSCIYLIVLWSVRKFSGGFHAKTYWLCRASTLCTYLFILLANRIIAYYDIITVLVFDIFALITMIKFAPIRHPNKELTQKEIRVNKLFSVLITLFFTLLSIVLTIFNRKEGVIISLTLFAIAVLMYIGLLANRKKGGNL